MYMTTSYIVMSLNQMHNEHNTSYGLICISKFTSPRPFSIHPILQSTAPSFQKSQQIPSNIRILIVQRKDSLAFPEFVRLKYISPDISPHIRPHYMQLLVSTMTADEKSILLTGDFTKVGARAFTANAVGYKLYNRARAEYERLFAAGIIQELVKNASDGLELKEPEWGFPKGRRDRGETELQCALREVYEETGYSERYFKIKNPITETIIGTNGIKYKHVYFMAVTDPRIPMPHPQQLHEHDEISNIAWVTRDEAIALLSPEKHTIVDHAFKEFTDIITRV